MRRQEGKARLQPGRLFLSALLAVVMAATLLCPGGTAALAEELPAEEIIELDEEQPADGQGQGEEPPADGQGQGEGRQNGSQQGDEPPADGQAQGDGQQNGSEQGDEVIELGEPEATQNDDKDADDVAVATQDAGDAVASVTAGGATTN